jgi:nucleoside-diphosphate-sugar epimerase
MHPREEADRLRLVVGCGYLGTRAARLWRAAGSRVIATTRHAARSAELQSLGAMPAVVDVTAADPGWDRLFAEQGTPDTVLWCVGFDARSSGTHRDVHVEGLGRLLDALARARAGAPPPRVVFTSSTGVWGDDRGGVVNEATPPSPTRDAARALVDAEALLAAHPVGPGVVLRLAGLYGPGRLPRLDDLRAGRPIAADPESWLNLVHIDDAAAIVVAVADAVSPDRLYVVSDGRPVRRRDWYGRLATLTGSPEPRWDQAAPRSRGSDKRVDPSRLFRDLRPTLAHPDALAALAALVPAG